MNVKLVRELVEEVRGELERGEVRTVEEGLSKRGVSRKLFREHKGRSYASRVLKLKRVLEGASGDV